MKQIGLTVNQQKLLIIPQGNTGIHMRITSSNDKSGRGGVTRLSVSGGLSSVALGACIVLVLVLNICN